jgi:hypothetical protein
MWYQPGILNGHAQLHHVHILYSGGGGVKSAAVSSVRFAKGDGRALGLDQPAEEQLRSISSILRAKRTEGITNIDHVISAELRNEESALHARRRSYTAFFISVNLKI